MRNLHVVLTAMLALSMAGPAFAFTGYDPNIDNRSHAYADGGDARSNSDAAARANADADARSSSNSGAAAGVFGSGNSDVRLGPIGNGSGNSDVTVKLGGGAGSFSPTSSSAINLGDARIGNARSGSQSSADSRNDLVNTSTTSTNTNTSTANDQNTTIDASDRSTTTTIVKDRKDPVASAAPTFASACSSGVSAQTMGFGGSLSATNPMCDVALAIEFARANGDQEMVDELTEGAAKYARARMNPVRRWAQWLPIIGSIW